MSPAPQSYATHRRYVPVFHFFVLPILTANAVGKIMDLVHVVDFDHVMAVLVAIALALAAVCARTFALRAQDRVIRLEMRQRLAAILPADLRARIDELRPGQLIALRFASDTEMASLVTTVLKGDVQRQNDIKKLIRNWQPDTMRV